MTVIVVVRKGRTAAIAADTMSSQGSLKVPGEMKTAPRKIHAVGGAYVGLTGSSAHHHVFQSVADSHPDLLDFSDARSIFESFRSIQSLLKDEYFLLTDEDDDHQEYESNQLFGLICAPGGIFSFQSYREVTEFNSFWASGTGTDVALGALQVAYSSRRSAMSVAECAVEAACLFDKDCGLPLESFEVRLRAGGG